MSLPEWRELPPPELPTILANRDTYRGIQRLADAGYDTTAYMDRLERKTLRRRDNGHETRRNETRRQARYQAVDDRPFIGWDGEGWTDTDGEHRYNYMANSLGMYVEWPQLTTLSCLELILSTGANYPGAIHTIYGGGYDVTHIVRDLPLGHRAHLREFGSVSWNGYRLEFIPHKWFTVRGQYGEGRVSVTIYDVMTFFQTSFIKALRSRGLEVPEEVITGKALRAAFTDSDRDFIRRYTGEELRLLVLLCETLRSEFREAGMPVRKYYGPGAVADAINKQYRIGRHLPAVPNFGPEMELVAQRAYFGGRFEPFQIGHHEGRVYQADICSAYPDKIARLPSLAGARWEYRDHWTGELGIWRCTHQETRGDLLHPAPWRDRTGAVGFPGTVDEVWLWTFEARFCSQVHEGWVLILANDDLPFSFIPGMYKTRREWKAAGRGGHWALKLALNSGYGKQAQRVGGRDGKPPRWHCLVWAGMVTSESRGQLWEAMVQDPEAVVAVETDSVMTTRRLDLDYGTDLGQWELAEYDWVTYLQSGVYWTDNGLQIKTKTRGVDPSELSHDLVMEYLSGDQSQPLYTSVHRFIALTNPDVSNYGQWVDSARELGINGGKRWHVPATCSDCQAGTVLSDRLHRMVPAMGLGIGPSKPHPLPWRTDVPPNLPGVDTAEDMTPEGWSDEFI